MVALRLLGSLLGGVCLLVVILLWHLVAGLLGLWLLGVPSAFPAALVLVFLIAQLEYAISMGPLYPIMEGLMACVVACVEVFPTHVGMNRWRGRDGP